jgi:hypothetical protein
MDNRLLILPLLRSRKYAYGWPPGEKMAKTRNVHIGSREKMDKEIARQKAHKLKAEALAIKL